jgi:hypothetical protein
MLTDGSSVHSWNCGLLPEQLRNLDEAGRSRLAIDERC